MISWDVIASNPFFPEIKKSHEMEKKSLEDMLHEKQESLEVGQSHLPSPPKTPFLRFVWFG